MSSLSGLKRFGGTPSPPSEGAFDCLVSWRGMRSRPGASAFSFVCVVIPHKCLQTGKGGGAIDFREIS